MKKVFGAILIILSSLLILCACSRKESVSGISVKDYAADSVVETAVGQFDYSEYTLIVSYDSGRTEEIPVREEMISASDRMKTHVEGDHAITVSYSGLTAKILISVKRNTFEDISFPQNNVFTYDGTAHTVELMGDIPAMATVTYPQGNSFVNAGNYEVVAVVSCDGYVTKTLTASVKVERAVYDMSGVAFESKEFVYDGKDHILSVSGTLPDGVLAPSYYISGSPTSGVSDVGTYEISAVFTSLNSNYDPIPDLTATLTIKKATHNVGELELIAVDSDGEVLDHGRKSYDGRSVSVRISSASKLPAGTGILYTITPEGGEEGAQQQSVFATDAGKYTVRAYFLLPDSKNYEPIPPVDTEIEIEKASIALDGAHLDAEYAVYDGEAHSLALVGEIPEWISVSYEYYLNGQLLTDGEGLPVSSVVNAGRYTVKAVFEHSDANYEEIAPLSAVLNVDKATVSIVGAVNTEKMKFEKDGQAKTVTENFIPEELDLVKILYKVVSDGDEEIMTEVESAVEVGEYAVKFVFTPKDDTNYRITGSSQTIVYFTIYE